MLFINRFFGVFLACVCAVGDASAWCPDNEMIYEVIQVDIYGSPNAYYDTAMARCQGMCGGMANCSPTPLSDLMSFDSSVGCASNDNLDEYSFVKYCPANPCDSGGFFYYNNMLRLRSCSVCDESSGFRRHLLRDVINTMQPGRDFEVTPRQEDLALLVETPGQNHQVEDHTMLGLYICVKCVASVGAWTDVAGATYQRRSLSGNIRCFGPSSTDTYEYRCRDGYYSRNGHAVHTNVASLNCQPCPANAETCSAGSTTFSCKNGYYKNSNNACFACPTGTYSQRGGNNTMGYAETCKSCPETPYPAGSTLSKEGATSISDCFIYCRGVDFFDESGAFVLTTGCDSNDRCYYNPPQNP